MIYTRMREETLPTIAKRWGEKSHPKAAKPPSGEDIMNITHN
jgi:hypothetical protein